jgi:hypothetical protein
LFRQINQFHKTKVRNYKLLKAILQEIFNWQIANKITFTL